MTSLNKENISIENRLDYISDTVKQINTIFPLLKVARLTEWETNFHLSFSWLKNLNNKYWKPNVNKVLFFIKKYIINSLNSSEENCNLRVIQDNYKNLNLNLNLNVDKLNLKYLNINKIVLVEGENFVFTEDEHLEEIIKEFNFWISMKENHWNTLEDKMKSFYKTNFLSNLNSNNFHTNNKDLSEALSKKDHIIEKVVLLVDELKKIEDEIYENINNSQIESLDFWNSLNIIKKWWTSWNIEVDQLFKTYKNIIDVFDIIMPFVWELNFEKLEKSIEKYEAIINKIKNGIELSEEEEALSIINYKWVITKKEFTNKISWQKWILFFIDIIWMWIANMEANRENIIEFILEWSNSEQAIKSKLLEAWLSITNKLLKVVLELKKNYKESKVTIEWDEIFIFIPELDIKLKDIKNAISIVFSNNNLKARSAYFQIKDSETSSKQILQYCDKLDNITGHVNKPIEDNKEFYDLEEYHSSKSLNEDNTIKSTEILFRNRNYSLVNKEIIEWIIKAKKVKNINFYEVNNELIKELIPDKDCLSSLSNLTQENIFSIIEEGYIDIFEGTEIEKEIKN